MRDTGSGIEQEIIERMFEPLFTTKEVGKGTGMGLSTVHGIVHEHGGHILVTSIPGEGAEFRVVLPAFDGKRRRWIIAATCESQVITPGSSVIEPVFF